MYKQWKPHLRSLCDEAKVRHDDAKRDEAIGQQAIVDELRWA
jgi:hypothetical protein